MRLIQGFDRGEASDEYQRLVPYYRELETEVVHSLESVLVDKVKIHSITSRIKEYDSVLSKFERKLTYEEEYTINDIVGTRVICLFLDDVERISEIIRNNFDIIEQDNKISDNDISSFGYMSSHFVVKLKETLSGPRYDHIKGMTFEIQVRTISMEAWANISHYLDYKSEADLPEELKKDFFALSGLFYVADTHFQMFSKASESSKVESHKKVQNILEGNIVIDDDEINMDSITALFEEKYPTRLYDISPKETSILISELIEAGYNKLSVLVPILDEYEETFLEYEEKYKNGDRFNATGVVRITLGIHDENYRNSMYTNREKFKEFKHRHMRKNRHNE